MKIRPVGADIFHADGRTNMTKLILVFRNSSKVPNKSLQLDGYKEANFSLRPFRLGLFLPDPDNGTIL